MDVQPPRKVTCFPTVALSAGHGTMPKSSPKASWIFGIAHSPHHCMAASSWVKADGSHQSVGAPSRSDPVSASSRSLRRESFASGVVKPIRLSAVRFAVPADQSTRSSRAPPPNAGVTPASLPMNRPFTPSRSSARVALISSSMVVGGCTPAAASRLLR
jgi:hypothetical protein